MVIFSLKMALLRILLVYLVINDYGLNAITKYKVLTYEFVIPNLYPHKNNLHICTSIKIRDQFNLVGFEPIGSMHGAHQMLLYGCSEPNFNYSVWNCGGKFGPCSSSSASILYAWSPDTPALDLPKSVGFRVGGHSEIQYLVLQVQFLHRLEKSKYLIHEDGNSGISIKYTKQDMPLQAGIILLETTNGVIPPNGYAFVENACTLLVDKVIHPWTYRTHTHNLGEMVTGYVVRQGTIGDKWSVLGKKDPQLRQMFYRVTDNAPILPGDVLATRCTMHNPNSYAVRIGKSLKDEKCQFYLMYWVENDTPLEKKYCYSPGPPVYYWTRGIENFQNIPRKDFGKDDHIEHVTPINGRRH